MGQNRDRTVPLVFHSGTVGHNGKKPVCNSYRDFHKPRGFSTKPFFSNAWDSGTRGLNFIRHNNKVSHQTVPFP
jgi:hypothetical protein